MIPLSFHKSLIASTYGDSNLVTVLQSTLRTNSALSWNFCNRNISTIIVKWYLIYLNICIIRIFKIRSTYSRGRVFVINFEMIHSSDQTLYVHKDVLKDKLSETAFIFFRVPSTIKDPHLFDKCRLSRSLCALDIKKDIKSNNNRLTIIHGGVKQNGTSFHEKFLALLTY